MSQKNQGEVPAKPAGGLRKFFKRLIVALLVLLILVVLGLVGYTLYQRQTAAEEAGQDPSEYYQELQEEYENITFDEDSGIAYMNNEVIIMAADSATPESIKAIVQAQDGVIVESLEDIGFYRIRLDKDYSVKQLDRMIERLLEKEEIAGAYINPVLSLENDMLGTAHKSDAASASAGEKDDSKSMEASGGEKVVLEKEPFYPSDPWKKASWNMDVPAGANWGVEAVHAPAAWAYLSELNPVKIGLIDTMVNTDHPDLDATCYLTFTDYETGEVVSGTVTSKDWKPEDHGCHVAGIMAAKWNNEGMSGILGDKADLYYSAAYTVKDNKDVNSYYDAYDFVKAIKMLVDNGVQSINISLNTNRLIGFAASHGNENAIEHLERQATLAGAMLSSLIKENNRSGKGDFVICVAAGNNNAITYCKDEEASYGYKKAFWPWEYANGESGGSLALHNNFLNLIDNTAVKSRIMVVGSAGINQKKSDTEQTRYAYSYFSNVGDRVDIVAPGEDIYSCYKKGYDYMSGTSMATPFVTAAAGMVFAANPELSGPEVKKLVCASTYGRLYFEGGSKGMLDLGVAMQNALETREHSVNRVIKETTTDGIDLCFLVDTTGSMEDDIENTKENMAQILNGLAQKNSDYRIALIDYRDFPERTKDSKDYPARLQLDFSGDQEKILAAINGLTLGYGGDNDETVYSGFAEALKLDWRSHAKKVIIVLGDAAPLNPEPYTDYTYDSVLRALYDANIGIDTDSSDDRVLGAGEDSMINVYSIGTEASGSAEDFFEKISEATGGAYTDVSSASKVSDAIMDSIEMIDITELLDVSSDFGKEFSDEVVEIYRDGEFLFEFALDEDGCFELENMEADKYEWSIPRLAVSGELKVREADSDARIETEKEWYSFVLVLWQRHRLPLIFGAAGALILLIVGLIIRGKMKKWSRARKAAKEQAEKLPQPGASETDEQKAKFCPQCGVPVTPGARFCSKCGKPL